MGIQLSKRKNPKGLRSTAEKEGTRFPFEMVVGGLQQDRSKLKWTPGGLDPCSFDQSCPLEVPDYVLMMMLTC